MVAQVDVSLINLTRLKLCAPMSLKIYTLIAHEMKKLLLVTNAF